MQRDKLVYTANQIATFFESANKAVRSAGVADHINKFWEPRMRTQLFERLDSGCIEGFHPLVLEAAPSIRRPEKPLEQRTTTEEDA